MFKQNMVDSLKKCVSKFKTICLHPFLKTIIKQKNEGFHNQNGFKKIKLLTSHGV
jgi:hypothetical protein